MPKVPGLQPIQQIGPKVDDEYLAMAAADYLSSRKKTEVPKYNEKMLLPPSRPGRGDLSYEDEAEHSDWTKSDLAQMRDLSAMSQSIERRFITKDDD